MDSLPVGCLAQLRHQLVKCQIEGSSLVLGRRLRSYYRALGAKGDLDTACLVVLSLVPLGRYLYLDANSPVVELLESSDLLIHVGAELIRHIAMSGLDDNIHVYLHRGGGGPNDGRW